MTAEIDVAWNLVDITSRWFSESDRVLCLLASRRGGPLLRHRARTRRRRAGGAGAACRGVVADLALWLERVRGAAPSGAVARPAQHVWTLRCPVSTAGHQRPRSQLGSRGRRDSPTAGDIADVLPGRGLAPQEHPSEAGPVAGGEYISSHRFKEENTGRDNEAPGGQPRRDRDQALRAANELGIATVAVYPHEDRNSQHRSKADEAYQIGEEDIRYGRTSR